MQLVYLHKQSVQTFYQLLQDNVTLHIVNVVTIRLQQDLLVSKTLVTFCHPLTYQVGS